MCKGGKAEMKKCVVHTKTTSEKGAVYSIVKSEANTIYDKEVPVVIRSLRVPAQSFYDGKEAKEGTRFNRHEDISEKATPADSRFVFF